MTNPTFAHPARLMALLLGLTLAASSQAGLLDYSFSGSANSGSFLNLGSGNIDLSGASFTATGTVVDATDLEPGDTTVGLFAATTVYDFGTLGSFVTDAAADFYLQFQDAGIFILGLADSFATGGFFPIGSGNPFTDPNVLQAVGSVTFDIDPTNSGSRLQTNAAGHQLSLVSTTVTSAITSAVPLPATLPLMLLALVPLRRAAMRRRRLR